MKNYTKEDIIYLAGILDGEGCLIIHRQKEIRKSGKIYIHSYPRTEVSNTSQGLVDWLYKKFGGHCRRVQPKGNRKIQYRWLLRRKEMLEILPEVIPYLIIKKNEAKENLEFLLSR